MLEGANGRFAEHENQEAAKREEKRRFEQLLWEKAEELAEMRQNLTERMNMLYDEIQSGQVGGTGLHAQELSNKKQEEYWDLNKKVQEIKETEAKVERLLGGLEDGTADIAEIERFVAKPESEQKKGKLSKYKQRLIEEKERLGVDPRGIRDEMYGEFGSEKMHLTTGRNVGHRVKGNFDPLDAEGEFFRRTADTHGGKVEHGKKGSIYVSKSGKHIRKF